MHLFLFTIKQSLKQSLAVSIFERRRVLVESLMLEPAYTYCDGAFLYSPAVILSSKTAYTDSKPYISASSANDTNNKIKYNF